MDDIAELAIGWRTETAILVPDWSKFRRARRSLGICTLGFYFARCQGCEIQIQNRFSTPKRNPSGPKPRASGRRLAPRLVIGLRAQCSPGRASALWRRSVIILMFVFPYVRPACGTCQLHIGDGAHLLRRLHCAYLGAQWRPVILQDPGQSPTWGSRCFSIPI
jgi:hypothetical protein